MSRNVAAFDTLLPMPKDGASLYTWMKFADDAQGNGMSDNPEGKAYVGFAYNKPTPEESDNPADYKWQKVEGDPGEKGDKGDPGNKGDPGDTTLTMYIDKPVLIVPVDADTGSVLVSKNFGLTIRLQHGSYFDALGDSNISTLAYITDNSSSTTAIAKTLTSDSVSSMFAVSVFIPSGQATSKRITEISFTLTHVYAGTVYGKVQIIYIQRGPVGSIGKTVPQPYPCGWWNVAETYVVKNNYAPMVGYPKCAEPLYYVRTENALKFDSDGSPLDPATDYATYGGAGAWLLFEKYAAINVEFLMANWARFGNAEGGVFWEHYLFSSLGKKEYSDASVDYSSFVDSATPIFDEDTKELTGVFTPHLLIDFKNGRILCDNVELSGIINAIGGTFTDGEVSISNGKVVFNRDGSGNIAGKGLLWNSVGEVYQAYGMQPLWLSVQKSITLKQRFLYMSAYGGHMLDSLLGVYFDTRWDVMSAGDDCHQYLLLPTPQSFTSLGTVEDLYIKVSKREFFFFWFCDDDVNDSFYIRCHKDGFIMLRQNSGEIVSLNNGDFIRPKEGVICKLEYTGTCWFGDYMYYDVFKLS